MAANAAFVVMNKVNVCWNKCCLSGVSVRLLWPFEFWSSPFVATTAAATAATAATTTSSPLLLLPVLLLLLLLLLHLLVDLPTYLPACLPTYSPTLLLSYLPHRDYLRACMHACLPTRVQL